MTAKQYLQEYKRMEGLYKAALEEYTTIEQDVISLSSPGLDEKVQSSIKSDPIYEIVIKLEKQRGKIGMQIVNYRTKMLVIRNQISEIERINAEYCVVLLLRYVLYKDWKCICHKLNVSRTQANKIHVQALNEFDKLFKGKYEYL